jgi:glycosyltransferase involved in cell wall biosynthesis
LTRYASERIIFENTIFDLDNFLKDKFACLAPILWGAGMNGKIGEALSYGIPVVTTTLGAIPWKLQNTENALIADDAFMFNNYITLILRNEELWKKLSDNGKKLMKQYSSKNLREKILEVI